MTTRAPTAGTGCGRQPGRMYASWRSQPCRSRTCAAARSAALPPAAWRTRGTSGGREWMPLGADAARLALLHLLYLQKATRRAVRTRQDEAATMLARAAIEHATLSACTASTSRVPWRGCRAGAEDAADHAGVPRRDCWRGLAAFPAACSMSASSDSIRNPGRGAEGLGDGGRRSMPRLMRKIAVSLYNRYYRPTSNFALHAGAVSLLRHVRADAQDRRPAVAGVGPTDAARIADACVGGLTALPGPSRGPAVAGRRPVCRSPLRARRPASRRHEPRQPRP